MKEDITMKKGFLLIAACICFLTGCVSEQRGAVCFTFDDYHGPNWLKAVPLFQKYDAHATFFVVGEITPPKAEVMKKLKSAGHTVGLHSLHHRDAVPFIHRHGEARYIEEEIRPQLEACRKYGLEIRSFAYPNNRRDEASDRMLSPYFDHFRAGRGPAKKTLYYPLKELPEKCYLVGTGIGTYYKSDLAVLKKELDHAAETGSVVVYFSHNIGPKGKIKKIDMPVEWLEELLAHAKKLELHIVGFDELNALKASAK